MEGFWNIKYGYHIRLLNKALSNDCEAILELVKLYHKVNEINKGNGFPSCDYYPSTIIGRYLADNFDEGDAGYTDSKWHNVEGSTNIIDLLDKIQNGDTAKTKELFKMVDMDIKYNKEPLQVTPYYSFKEEIDQCRNIAERKAKEKAERKAKEEAERKAKEEAERKAKEEAERKAKEEAERKAKEEAERKAKEEEAERKAKEEAERIAKEEAERKAKEEAERKAKEEAERKAKEEAERKAKEEAERKAKEEAERKAKEEAERIAKEEAERIAKEEAERKAKEEAERKVKEEAERKAKEEIKEEAERIAKEEAERKAKEEAERKAKEEAERKAKEEAERKAKEGAERNSYKSLIEDFVSDIKECEYKDGIIFGKKKKIHYVANPITKRIWNAVVNKSSEADFDDNEFVPQKELGTFLENLNSYYSGKIVFEYLHKNIHALVHLQVYEKQDKNACFVYIKEEN